MDNAVRFRRALLGPDLDPVDDVWMTVKDGIISGIGIGEAPAGIPYHPAAVALPGLVDCHVHLGLSGGADVQKDSAALEGPDLTDLIETNATLHLRSGVTTVRDLGSPVDAALRSAKSKSSHIFRSAPGRRNSSASSNSRSLSRRCLAPE